MPCLVSDGVAVSCCMLGMVCGWGLLGLVQCLLVCLLVVFVGWCC